MGIRDGFPYSLGRGYEERTEMMNNFADCELIYTAEIHFTGVVEYGVSMEKFSSGLIRLPLSGARFDQTFEGVLRGPRLSGRISGTDYLYVRPDGLFQLHLHGQFCTPDGVNISMSSTGVSMPTSSGAEARIRSAVFLFSADDAYEWINQLQLWAVGTLDLVEKTGLINAYAV